jgi:hypothetical protein
VVQNRPRGRGNDDIGEEKGEEKIRKEGEKRRRKKERKKEESSLKQQQRITTRALAPPLPPSPSVRSPYVRPRALIDIGLQAGTSSSYRPKNPRITLA